MNYLSHVLLISLSITLVFAPFICSAIIQYPKFLTAEFIKEYHDIMNIPKYEINEVKIFDIQASRYPNNSQLQSALYYLPFISYFFGNKQEAENKNFFLALETLFLLIITCTFLASGVNFSSCIDLVFYIALFMMAAIDYHSKLIPDEISITTLSIGQCASLSEATIPATTSITGAMTGYLTPWLVTNLSAALKKDNAKGMGNGDFKMLAVVGAWLGPYAVLNCLLTASVIMLLIFACVKVFKINTTKELAFGPAIAISAFIIKYFNFLIIQQLSLLQ